MLTQQKFLNASISQFSGAVGWGSEPSTLNVTLVEDPKALDAFTAPAVGQPINFVYSGWQFRGILQSWKYSKSESGFIYNVVCTDPREVLDGYQLILGGYTQAITSPNIANVYGFYESSAFGSSQRNETGIPWQQVRSAATSIINGGGAFGGAISLRGTTYSIDLSQLPNIDPKYRVGSESMSLMEYISEICEAGSHDFYINVIGGNTIKVFTIDRSTAVPPGALTSFVASNSNITSSEVGVEFRNEPVGKFLTGPNRVDMWIQNVGGQSIWPFWDFETNFNLKMGTGINNAHTVTLDSRSVQVPGVGPTYETDVDELRSVLDSQAAWETFLQFHSPPHVTTGIHINKYDDIGIIGSISKAAKVAAGIAANMQTKKEQSEKASDAMDDDHEEAVTRMYSFLLGYARDYYGKQFMVDIPNVDAAIEPDTDKVRLSYETESLGFIDPDAWDLAISNNIIPQDANRLAGEDGRFPPYVRYDNIVSLDFSEVPDDQIIYNAGQTSAFIKCGIREGVAFENVSNVTGPRAVVVLPGVVRQRITPGENNDQVGAIRTVLDDDIINGNSTPAEKENYLNGFGVDNQSDGRAGLAILPDMAAIPLKNNKQTYGPWQSVGSNGKMIFEQDPSLVPWNYGGFAEMNIVGDAKVNDNVSTMQELETGSIEIPGVPAYTMGQQLVGGGPYVTDVTVTIGEGGVTSRYQFSTWTPRFGRLRKANIQRLSLLAKKNAQNERAGRSQLVKTPGLSNLQREIRTLKKTKRKGGTSSHGVISGEGFADSGVIYPNVFVQPHYNFTSQLGGDYQRKAGMSMDGLFRPFTTNPDATGIGMAHYQTPEENAEFPTATDLDPFKSGHDIVMAVRGSTMPDDLTLRHDSDPGSDYRAMALRGPLIMTGPGYDINGKPVPNESGGPGETRTDNYESGYQRDQSKWPCGPVYMPWDDERKCWVGGGGTKAKIVKLVSDSSGNFPNGYRSGYNAIEVLPSWDGNIGVNKINMSGTGDELVVGNFRGNIAVESGIYYSLQINGRYYIDNQLTFFGGMI